MKVVQHIKEFVSDLATVIKTAAKSISDRYKRWRERRKQYIEYIRNVQSTTIVYQPSSADAELISDCKNLVSQEFPNGIESSLLPLSLEERSERIVDFTKKVADLMNVQLDDIVFFSPSEYGGAQGFYSHDSRRLMLNIAYLAVDEPQVLKDVLNTIFHECKHCRQYSAIVDGVDYGYSKELLKEWMLNSLNYIPPEVNDEAYRKQPLEADAFGFADSIIKSF